MHQRFFHQRGIDRFHVEASNVAEVSIADKGFAPVSWGNSTFHLPSNDFDFLSETRESIQDFDAVLLQPGEDWDCDQINQPLA